jgi:hypothetical protein
MILKNVHIRVYFVKIKVGLFFAIEDEVKGPKLLFSNMGSKSQNFEI